MKMWHMNGPIKYWVSVILFVFTSGFVNGQSESKIKIMTSIYPFYEFAQNVSGMRGDVEVLLPPGSEVHTWNPKPSDIIKLNGADLFIGVGPNLEPWLDEVLKSIDNPGLRIIEAGKIVPFLEHDEGEHTHGRMNDAQDPHLWLDFMNDIRIVEAITRSLIELEPSNADLFTKNASDYADRLNSLDKKYRDTLESCSTRILIMGGHSAFGYLAERYGLDQVSVYGTSPDAQPSPRQVVDIIQMAQANGVKAVFFERTVSDNIARTIAREIGGRVLPLNPAASLSRDELREGIDFIQIMEKNLENLKIGLACK